MTRSIRVLIAAVPLLALGGCTDDGSDREQRPAASATEAEGASTTGDVEVETTSTSAPPAETEHAFASQALEELMDRFDEVVAQILADPRVAGDAGHPAVRAYTDLFVPGSEFATGALEAWVELGAEGRFHRPGPRGRMYESTVADVVVDETGRTATFSVCSLVSVEVVDASGRPISGEGGQSAGTGVAELVDSRWRLRELTEVSPEVCDGEASS